MKVFKTLSIDPVEIRNQSLEIIFMAAGARWIVRHPLLHIRY